MMSHFAIPILTRKVIIIMWMWHFSCWLLIQIHIHGSYYMHRNLSLTQTIFLFCFQFWAVISIFNIHWTKIITKHVIEWMNISVIHCYLLIMIIPNNNSTNSENSMQRNDYVNLTVCKFAQIEYVSCGTLVDTWTKIGMQLVATIAVQQCPIILHIFRSIFIFRYEQWTIDVVYHSFDRFTFNR